MGTEPGIQAYDFPVQRTHKSGTLNRGVLLMVAVCSCLVAGNYYFHLKQGWPQLDGSTIILGLMETYLLFALYKSKNYSAAISIDKSGLQSELGGERHTWSWKDIADVSLEVARFRGQATDATVRILSRTHPGQDRIWVHIDSVGYDPWRLEATIRKGMQLWGKPDNSDF